MPPPYLWHPVAVHFPIALLLAGLGFGLASRRRAAAAWLAEAASWLLWLGTAAAWLAVGLGLLAEETAPHVPPAWKTMERHETLAFWSAGLFTALSLWRRRWRRRGEGLFLALWLAAAGVLLATGYYGGELVFAFGLGVRP